MRDNVHLFGRVETVFEEVLSVFFDGPESVQSTDEFEDRDDTIRRRFSLLQFEERSSELSVVPRKKSVSKWKTLINRRTDR